ncbi:MAG: beta-lactamase family protein [Acidobacteria bacterium]|nr:beta-lactamase family protein [Acidobacteriota bacterium]MCA1621504.1 beta-lactamase family protein [Acidobacteriota bacterium]
MQRRAFLLGLAALAASARAEGGGKGSNPALLTAVDSIAADALRGRPLPGLSVAVARGGRTVLAKGYGFADLERKVPATPETVYQIGSVSKQFTAAAVMRLVEQKKVRLDDPLTKYLPDYPTRGHRPLVRHLLGQTSGIKEFFTVRGFDEMESGPPERYSRQDLIDLFKKEPFVYAPGERWAYSNSNYTLLGRIVESASGRTFDQYLQETFFRPLGMSATHSCGARPAGELLAKGYMPGGGGFTPAPPVNMNTAVGDGGLCASVLDLVAWTRALTTGRAVSRASYRMMTTPERVRRGYRPDYGFGLSLVPLDGRRRVGHNGDITGFMSALAYYPDDDLTVAVLTNRALHWPEVIERSIARRALGLPTPVVKDLPLDDAGRRAYAGTYDFGVYPLYVKDEGGRLRFYMGLGRPTYTLLYQGGHAFVAGEDPDAIRLSFSMKGGRADNLLLRMASMHWYADRVG